MLVLEEEIGMVGSSGDELHAATQMYGCLCGVARRLDESRLQNLHATVACYARAFRYCGLSTTT